MNPLIPLFVAIPLGAAFLVPMLARPLRWFPDVVGNLTLLVLTGLSVHAVGLSGVYAVGGWLPTAGRIPLGIHMHLDGLAVLMLLAINGIGLAATLYSVPYLRTYTSKGRYYSLFLLMVAGMNGVALSGDLFNLFVFMEVAAIASYALVGFGCSHEELEASFKYVVLGSVASTFVLLGVAVIYAMTGTLNMVQMAQRLSGDLPAGPVLFALALLVGGFGLKAALVPFHAWLPDAHPSAPAPISAMLSGVVIKALGIYALVRVVFNVFGASPLMLGAVRWLGLVSMVVGVLLAIGQWDMKRLFAYHSISQIGYVALGLGLGTPLGLAGGLFHMLNHSVFKSLLFLNAGAVEYATGTRDLKQLGGLARRMPVTAVTSLIASMSIAGVPPFNGFWSKLIIVLACVQAGRYGAALAAIVVSLLTLASFLKVQRYGFHEAAAAPAAPVKRTPVLMGAAMILLAVLCAGLGLLALPGLERPLVVTEAVDALRAGPFGLAAGMGPR